MQREKRCEVCFRGTFRGQIFHGVKCKECKKLVHKFCYVPDLQDQKFRCDECKYGRGKSTKCCLCKTKDGILKHIGGKTWVHVICALTSERVKVKSYYNLVFEMPAIHGQRQEEFTCCRCGNSSPEAFPCSPAICENCAHANCVLRDFEDYEEGKEFWLTFGLLNKHKHMLTTNLSHKKQKFMASEWLQWKQEKKNIMVCGVHNDDPNFIFCICGKTKWNDDSSNQVVCEVCLRWFHLECCDFDDKFKDQDYICKGCRKNDYFIKFLQLPEIIERVVEIERSIKLNKQSLKFLDHFSLNYSKTILKKLLLQDENIVQIERYLLSSLINFQVRHQKRRSGKCRYLCETVKEVEILEMTYALVKKKRKELRQISLESWKKIRMSLMNKGEAYGLDPDSVKRLEKFVNERLSYLSKYQANSQLVPLNKACSILSNPDLASMRPELMAQQIRQAVSYLEHSDIDKRCFKMVESASPINYLQIVYRSRFSVNDVRKMLISFENAINYEPFEISKQNYRHYTIVNRRFPGLKESKRNQIEDGLRKLLKHVKIVRRYEETYQQKLKAESVVSKDCSIIQMVDERKKLLQKGVFFDEESQFRKQQRKIIELNTKREQALKLIHAPQGTNLLKSIEIARQLLGDVEFKKQMSEKDRVALSQFQQKTQFYSSIISYHKESREGRTKVPRSLQDETESSSLVALSEIGDWASNESISQLAAQAMMSWSGNSHAAVAGLEILARAAKNDITFEEENEWRIVCKFADKVLCSLHDITQFRRGNIKPSSLQKVMSILRMTNNQTDPRYLFSEWYVKYISWKQVFEEIGSIEEALESDKQCHRIKSLIIEKTADSYGMPVNLENQVKKLRILKVWCQASLHYFQEKAKGHFTLGPIQSFKAYIDRIGYPNNAVSAKIESLSIEARQLNQKANRIFEKGLRTLQMDLSEQQRIQYHKMSREEALELRKNLQRSELFVDLQLQELEEQLHFAQELPSNLRELADSVSLSMDLQETRKKILELPLRVHSIQDYSYMVHRMYHLKCLEYDGNTTHREYMRMIEYGGTGAIDLHRRTNALYQAYKLLERARKEVLNHRPKAQYLLPLDGRKIKADMKDDLIESRQLQKIYNTVQRVKERMFNYKQAKVQYEKYQEILLELKTIPVNSSSIEAQIHRMKSDLDHLIIKINAVPQNDIFGQLNRCTEIVKEYRQNGIRSKQMQSFDRLVSDSRKIFSLGNNISGEDYKTLSLLCERQEFAQIDDIRRLRESAFRKVYREYISSPEPMMEVGQTLLSEGGYLCRYFEKTTELLPMMLKINQKIFQGDQNNVEVEQERRFQIEDELSDISESGSSQSFDSSSENSSPYMNY